MPTVQNAGNLKDPSNRTFYIPTFGTPGSDNLLVVTQGQIAPILAIGRIAAQTGQDVGDYLQKMKDFESNGKEHNKRSRINYGKKRSYIWEEVPIKVNKRLFRACCRVLHQPLKIINLGACSQDFTKQAPTPSNFSKPIDI